jgi:hypothetical protein
MGASGLDMRSGDIFKAHIVYDGTTITFNLTDTKTGVVFTHSFTVNIPSVIGSSSAYVGFTGATGGSTATQKILNWTYSPTN